VGLRSALLGRETTQILSLRVLFIHLDWEWEWELGKHIWRCLLELFFYLIFLTFQVFPLVHAASQLFVVAFLFFFCKWCCILFLFYSFGKGVRANMNGWAHIHTLRKGSWKLDAPAATASDICGAGASGGEERGNVRLWRVHVSYGLEVDTLSNVKCPWKWKMSPLPHQQINGYRHEKRKGGRRRRKEKKKWKPPPIHIHRVCNHVYPIPLSTA